MPDCTLLAATVIAADAAPHVNRLVDDAAFTTAHSVFHTATKRASIINFGTEHGLPIDRWLETHAHADPLPKAEPNGTRTLKLPLNVL